LTGNSKGKVFLVGAGPGDPGLLTLRAAYALQHGDVLLYDALAGDPIVAFAAAACEKIFVGKRGGDHAMPQAQIEALMIEKAREGKRVVRLKGGDPFVLGRGGEEAQALRAAGIPFEIVPGISSSIASPAYAGIPVTHREHNVAFTVATGHEDPTKPESTLDWGKLADPHRTLILLMAMGNLGAIARHLCERGLDAQTPVAVIQDGTRPTQRTVVGTLTTIAGDVEREGLQAPAIVVIGSVVGLREQLAWFDVAPLFGKRVLVTRPAHQAAAFAAALYARGAQPILAPTIAICAADDSNAIDAAIDGMDAFAWAVFTSRNGVDAIFDRLDALGRDPRAFARAKIAAIGPKTADALRWRGIRADLIPEKYVGDAAARALIAATQDGDRIAIFAAQDAPDTLARMLDAAQRPASTIAAYKTSFVEDAGLSSTVATCDVLTFASASSVAGFARALGGNRQALEAAHGKAIACIGPVTAHAATELGLHVDTLASEYTGDGLVDALEEFFASPTR
jgi:uroporphyrinogen III methyltransferase/synthase